MIDGTGGSPRGATMIIVSVWANGRLLDLFGGSQMQAAGAIMAVMAPLAVLTFRTRGHLRHVTKVLDAFAGVLVATAGVTVLHFAVAQADSSWLELRAPAAESSVLRAADNDHPAIFHIVLDAYGRSDTLAALYDFDNTPFVGWLEAQGFFVAHEGRANYSHTIHSLASTLNMDYLDNLVANVAPDSNNLEPLRRGLADSRVRRLLAEQGYTFVALDSGFWATTISSTPIYVASGQQNEFNRALLAMATATSSSGQRQSERERLGYAFRSLPELAARNERLFVFALFLAPHPPFVVARDGSDTGEQRFFGQRSASHLIRDGGLTRGDYKRQFRDQLHWVNNQLREAIVGVLAAAETTPIIIVHGDHGPGAFFSHDSWEVSYLHDRMSVLSAFLLPPVKEDATGQAQHSRSDMGDPVLVAPYSAMSHVNSYRLVLNRYFGTRFTPLPDRSFYATVRRPYRFVDVQDELDSETDRARLERLEGQPYFPSVP